MKSGGSKKVSVSEKLKEHEAQFGDCLAEPGKEVWNNFCEDSLSNQKDNWPELYEYSRVIREKNIPVGKKIRASLKKHLAELQNFRCCYCRRVLQNISYAKPIEHILSRKDYPQFSVSYRNISLSCFDCNFVKGADNWSNVPVIIKEYPDSAAEFSFFHPRFHEFDSHVRFFRYETNNVTISTYFGVTEIGRKLCSDLLQSISKREFLIANDDRMNAAFKTIKDLVSSVDEKDAPAVLEAYNVLGDAISGSR